MIFFVCIFRRLSKSNVACRGTAQSESSGGERPHAWFGKGREAQMHIRELMMACALRPATDGIAGHGTRNGSTR
jgi:hypothetical protein